MAQTCKVWFVVFSIETGLTMAKKAGDALIGVGIIMLVVIVSAIREFIVPILVLLAFAAVVGIVYWIVNFNQEKKDTSSFHASISGLRERQVITKPQTQISQHESNWIKSMSQPAKNVDGAWIQHCDEIEAAWRRGDWDWARLQLQKIAYGMVGKSVSQEEKNKFTDLMKDFAGEDPLYRQVMERLLPMVEANPGMTQSQIYKGQPDEIKEQMRYVLYFANELGDIRRVKRGNSYKLYLPGAAND